MRDDLRLLVDCLRLAWRRLGCEADHGELLHMDDELWVVCWRCQFQSRGIQVETARVRRAWAFDRMRLRFRWRRAS